MVAPPGLSQPSQGATHRQSNWETDVLVRLLTARLLSVCSYLIPPPCKQGWKTLGTTRL